MICRRPENTSSLQHGARDRSHDKDRVNDCQHDCGAPYLVFKIKEECAMEMRKRAEKVPGEAVRRGQLGKPNEASMPARTENSRQEEAALFLLRSGFRPGETTGQVQHVANPFRAGRTLGSVWHAMRRLVENEPERPAGAAQNEDH